MYVRFSKHLEDITTHIFARRFLVALFPFTMASDEADEDGPKPRTQPHLMPQDAATVDASKLTALTPEVVRLKIPHFRQSYDIQTPHCDLLARCSHLVLNN